MQLNPQWIVPLSSAGYGVIFSLALCGAANIASALAGAPISPETRNALFGVGCLVLVPITTYFQFASLFFRPTATENG